MGVAAAAMVGSISLVLCVCELWFVREHAKILTSTHSINHIILFVCQTLMEESVPLMLTDRHPAVLKDRLPFGGARGEVFSGGSGGEPPGIDSTCLAGA